MAAVEPAIETCGPGTRPVYGEATCAAVGTTSVPGGFVAGAWGFRPVLPEGLCTGPLRAALGETACVPLDDCRAAFPAPGATIAVSATPVSGLTTYATLDEAIAAAPVNATIAIDEGEFVAPAATLTKSVTLVGRCAQKSIVRATDFGFYVDKANVVLRSLTLADASRVALRANHAALLTLDRVYLYGDGNAAEIANGSKVIAMKSIFEGPSTSAARTSALTGFNIHSYSEASFSEVETRRYQLALSAQGKDTVVTVKKSVLHEQRAFGTDPAAIAMIGAFLGARVDVDQSHVRSRQGRIAMIGSARLDGKPDINSPGNPPASVRVTNGTLVHDLEPRNTGSVIDVLGGASLELDNVSIEHDSFVAVGTTEDGRAHVKNCVIEATPRPNAERIGFSAVKKGSLVVESTAVIRAAHHAAFLDDGSTAEIKGSLFFGTREIGIHDPTVFSGAGQALSVVNGSHAKVSDTTFLGNEGTAVYVQDATTELEHTVLATTAASTHGPFTAAITGVGATITVRESTFAKNQRGLALRGGRALLRDSAISDSAEALRLESLVFVETSEPLETAVDAQLVAARTLFQRNQVLVATKPISDE